MRDEVREDREHLLNALRRRRLTIAAKLQRCDPATPLSWVVSWKREYGSLGRRIDLLMRKISKAR